MQSVLERMEEKLQYTLPDFDRESLPSGPIRWKTNVQWCRHKLVPEGLMKSDSPWGLWEISEEGLQALKGGRR